MYGVQQRRVEHFWSARAVLCTKFTTTNQIDDF